MDPRIEELLTRTPHVGGVGSDHELRQFVDPLCHPLEHLHVATRLNVGVCPSVDGVDGLVAAGRGFGERHRTIRPGRLQLMNRQAALTVLHHGDSGVPVRDVQIVGNRMKALPLQTPPAAGEAGIQVSQPQHPDGRKCKGYGVSHQLIGRLLELLPRLP